MKINQLLSALTMITVLITAACGGAATTAAPAPTQPPAPTATPEITVTPVTTEAPVEPTLPPEFTVIPPPTEVPVEPPQPVTVCPTPTLIPQFNTEKMVTFALPQLALTDSTANAVILRVVPLLEPPTQTEDELLTSECGVVIGMLITERDLPLSDPQVPSLTKGEYQIKVQQGLIRFIDSAGKELITSLKADLRRIEQREVSPPETIITIKDICYSWVLVQVCTEPSPNMALTQEEKEKIQGTMQDSVRILVEKGLLQEAEINVAGTIPDMVGETAVKLQQASLLAAPTVNFPSDRGEEPVDGALLGVVVAVLDIDVPEYPSLLKGTYVVRAVQDEENKWQGLFISEDGVETFLPATSGEVRGQIEEPLAIVLDLRMILCFFSQRCS